MATKKINYKSDFELIYTLVDNEGHTLAVPDNPWELWLSVGNPLGTNVRKFVAKYDGGDYTNCRVQDDTIVVIADNHKLPTGRLWATFIDYQPNSDFPDGDKKIYTPQPCDVELITGTGDAPTETDIEILANYVVYEHNYVAGQGITIENDVISATGESYTAGNQIVIDEGTINVAVPFTDMVDQHESDIHSMGIDISSLDRRTTAVEESVATKASASDVTALSGRVTAVEGSIADLTTGKADQSDLTALGNRVSTIEGDYVTDTELAPISQDVNTLTTNYNSIVNALNQEITELIDGKAMIASALTDRGYPTQATDSSASMAQKIENMSYDAGWLAQLGYTEQNDGGVKDAVAYSKAIKDGWNPSATTRKFTNDIKLVYFPVVDLSEYTDVTDFFKNCTSLTHVVKFDISNAVTSATSIFHSCSALRYVPKLNTRGSNNATNLFYNCKALKRVEELDATNMTTNNWTNAMIFKCTSLEYMLIKGLGTPQTPTAITIKSSSEVVPWGLYTEENRQSLVDTLLTYSFDRATAEYSACTITLHADTLARLTAEEIAAITAKGFTLTS